MDHDDVSGMKGDWRYTTRHVLCVFAQLDDDTPLEEINILFGEGQLPEPASQIFKKEKEKKDL